MSNNRLTFLSNDSDPKATYGLIDENHKTPINYHNPTTFAWLKLSEWNDTETLFMILGIKTNGGYDGEVTYQFIDSTTGLSLITDLVGNYQGELFLSYDTFIVDLVQVDEFGVFTTAGNHNLVTNDKIWFSNVTGATELGSTEWAVTVLTSSTFTLQEEWEFPLAPVVFSNAKVWYVTDTETSVVNAPIIIKEDLS